MDTPQDTLSSPPPIANAQKIPRLAGVRILWTEDDIFLRDLMAAKLAQEGAVSFYARSGDECLELLGKPETGIPDVIVLDLILPGMSGFDVLTRIHENPTLSRVPIVVLSNLGQKEDIEKTKWLGAKRHLVKAETDPDGIVENIVAVLQESRASVPAAAVPVSSTP